MFKSENNFTLFMIILTFTVGMAFGYFVEKDNRYKKCIEYIDMKKEKKQKFCSYLAK